MNESTALPTPSYVLAVAACPEELLLPMGAMISAFTDQGTAVHAVLLSDGLPANATAKARIDQNHRLVRAAERIGITELIMLEHVVTDVARTGVDVMAGEVLGTMVRADAVLVADPAVRPDRTARGRLAAFRAALRVARAIGAAIYVCTAIQPGPKARQFAIEVEVSRARQRSAIAAYEGIPEIGALLRSGGQDVEFLLMQHRREPSLGLLPR